MPKELLPEVAAAAAAAAAAGGGGGVPMSPETARLIKDRQRFMEEFAIELVEDRFDLEYGLDSDSDAAGTEEEEGAGGGAGADEDAGVGGGRGVKGKAAGARRCALCKREETLPGLEDLYPVLEHRDGEHGHMIDPRGEWMCTYPLLLGNKGSRKAWVHRLCALFCPRAFMEGHRWFNVGKEVRVRVMGLGDVDLMSDPDSTLD